MRIHPVIVEDVRPGETVVRGDEGHHLARVLRVRPGDRVRAFDGRGSEADGVVRTVERDRVILALDEPKGSAAEPRVALTVAVGLLKGDKLADVVRMCTEIGARRFVLLDTRRAERGALSGVKRQRLERVAREAAKQSGRAVVPVIEGPLTPSELQIEERTLVADPNAGISVLAHVSDRPPGPAAWTTITGPEGGFEPAEVEDLVARGATPVSLGRSILRAETAPVVLASAVLLAAG